MSGKSRNPIDANFNSKNSTNLFGVGTAFPASPATNDRFFRTDLGWLCYYDGTRWLTVHEYTHSTILPIGTSVSNAYLATFYQRGGYQPYFTRYAGRRYVQTTNDVSNYWTIAAVLYTQAYGGGTTLDTFSTSADGVLTTTTFDRTPNTAQTNASYGLLAISFTKTGSPGSAFCEMTMSYRLIVT